MCFLIVGNLLVLGMNKNKASRIKLECLLSWGLLPLEYRSFQRKVSKISLGFLSQNYQNILKNNILRNQLGLLLIISHDILFKMYHKISSFNIDIDVIIERKYDKMSSFIPGAKKINIFELHFSLNLHFFIFLFDWLGVALDHIVALKATTFWGAFQTFVMTITVFL